RTSVHSATVIVAVRPSIERRRIPGERSETIGCGDVTWSSTSVPGVTAGSMTALSIGAVVTGAVCRRPTSFAIPRTLAQAATRKRTTATRRRLCWALGGGAEVRTGGDVVGRVVTWSMTT